jgi:dipeptidyl aminopeptidase/acylaminoacyl peptidase
MFPRIFAVVPARRNPERPGITPEMCVAGRDLTEPKLSPDGSRVAFATTSSGSAAIVVVAVGGGPERVLTTLPPPAAGRGLGGGCFDWVPDGSGIVYVATGGDLWSHTLAGAMERLTAHGPDARVEAPTVASDASFALYVVDQAQVWRCWLDRDRAPERLDDGSADFCFDPFIAADGNAAMWTAWNVPDMPWDAARVQRVMLDGSRREDEIGAGAVHQPRAMPDGSSIAIRDDTGWLNVWIRDRPLVDEPFEHAGPSWGMGQRSYAVSPDGDRVAFTRNELGFGRLCVADVATGAVAEIARGVHGQLTWVGDRLAAIRSGARTPTEVVVYDTSSWERHVLAVGPVVGWDSVELPEPETIAVEHDGVTLHARRYVAGGGRTLCCIHGGPTDQWQVEFMPRIAYWWSQGWDVLVPDPRGTTGHGRAYQQALRGGWGRLDVDDTAAILAASHRRGWSARERTVAMGGSSGGMTVLGILAMHDGLAAAGVAMYPVTDLTDLAARSHRFEAHYTVSLVGPLAARDLYRERSPLTFADHIRAPLLVLHGDADPVVPIEQSLRLVERIRSTGGDIEFHVIEGEGHGFRALENKLAEYQLIGDFVSRFG